MRSLLRAFFYLLYQPLAWTYDAVAWLVSLGRWRSWVETVLPELSGPRVLELGHGPGHLQVAMRIRDLSPVGIDLSSQMGRLAAERGRRHGFAPLLVRASGTQPPFRSGAFDQVVATFPTEYIVQPATLAAAHRVLRPGGSMVLLPVAWLNSRRPVLRPFAWLFRITGQAAPWTGAFSQALARAGFAVRERRVQLPDSEVMLVIATRE
jgi:ubiquinone/menaquinone biosynthesis C-methylase UbiE